MGKTKAVDVGDGRTWLLEVKFRDLGEGRATSSKQIVVPVEELEGLSLEDAGKALVELATQAKHLYVEHWANVYLGFHVSFRGLKQIEREMIEKLLTEAVEYGVEGEAVDQLREKLRLGSMTWRERIREMTANDLLLPKTQRLVARVAERQGT